MPAMTPIQTKEFRSRALQFLDGLRFPAARAQVLAHYTRKNTPMELIENTLTLPERTFDTAGEFAEALTAVQAQRPPHTWTSRELKD
jgi:hypothetical protein